MRPAVCAAIGVLATVAVGACGDGDSTEPAATTPRPPQRLAPAARTRAERLEQAILAYCARLALSVSEGREPPSARRQATAFEAARRLTELAGRNPDATVRPGVDTRLFVSDLIEDLEGSNCDSRLVAALEQGLAAPP